MNIPNSDHNPSESTASPAAASANPTPDHPDSELASDVLPPMYSRKPRNDSRLKCLPAKFQEEIAQFATNHSILQVQAWLAGREVQTSPPAICRFLAFYRQQQQVLRQGAALQVLMAKQPPEFTVTPDKLTEIGTRFFSALAIEQQHPRTWYLAQTTELRRAEFQLRKDTLEHEKKVFQAAEEERNKPVRPLTHETLELIERELNFFPPGSKPFNVNPPGSV